MAHTLLLRLKTAAAAIIVALVIASGAHAALINGTNCGFVTAVPTADPDGSATTLDQNTYGNRYVSPANAASITDVGFYVPYGQYGTVYDIGVYADNGSPGSATGSPIWIARNVSIASGAGWKNHTGLNVSISPSTYYWVVVEMDSSAGTTQIDRVQHTSEAEPRQTAAFNWTALPDPWSGGTLQDYAHMYAIYMKYAEPVGPSIPVLMHQYRQRRSQ